MNVINEEIDCMGSEILDELDAEEINCIGFDSRKYRLFIVLPLRP
jgi:hypothetical protein